MSQTRAEEGEERGGLFSPAVVLGLVLVGVISFAALVVFGTYAPDNRGKDSPGEHAMSRAAVGYSGMVNLLQGAGRSVLIARGPVTTRRPSMIILTLDGGDPKQELGNLPTTRGYGGPIVAVMPKWKTAFDRRDMGWTLKRDLADVPAQTWIGDSDIKGEKIVLGHQAGSGPRMLRWTQEIRAAQTGPIDRLQVFTTLTGWTPLIVNEAGQVILARRDGKDEKGEVVEGNFYALSDPDLLNNQGIANIATARAGIAVLDTVDAGKNPTIIFDVTLNGFARARSILKLAFEPPFVAATLAAFAAAVLAGWGAWLRFGAERRQGRVFALGKRALADNQAGLIRMADREHRMALPYAHLVRELVARAVGAPRELSPDQLEAFLDRVGASRGVTDKIADMTGQTASVGTPHALGALAQRLHQWRLEMTK